MAAIQMMDAPAKPQANKEAGSPNSNERIMEYYMHQVLAGISPLEYKWNKRVTDMPSITMRK